MLSWRPPRHRRLRRPAGAAHAADRRREARPKLALDPRRPLGPLRPRPRHERPLRPLEGPRPHRVLRRARREGPAPRRTARRLRRLRLAARPPSRPQARAGSRVLERLARPWARRRGRRRPDGPPVFCLLGDAELEEGSNWEAVQYAGRVGLGSLTAIVIDNDSHGWPVAGSVAGEAGDAGRTTAALTAPLERRASVLPRGLGRGAGRRPRPRLARGGAHPGPAGTQPRCVVAEVEAR